MKGKSCTRPDLKILILLKQHNEEAKRYFSLNLFSFGTDHINYPLFI